MRMHMKRKALCLGGVIVFCMLVIVLTRGDPPVENDTYADLSVLFGGIQGQPVNWKGNFTKRDRLIPHTIHQVWSTEYVPQSMVDWIQSWPRRHPDWRYVFWTREHILTLIRITIPDFKTVYETQKTNLHKSDLTKFLILYKYGGLYADLEMECLRPVDEVIDSHPCLVSQESPLHTSINRQLSYSVVSPSLMACRPQHPFYRSMIWPEPAYNDEEEGEDDSYLTLNNKAQQYIANLDRSSTVQDTLFLAAPSFFDPTTHGNYTSVCKDILVKYGRTNKVALKDLYVKQVEDCEFLEKKNFKDGPEKHSFSRLHWTDTSRLLYRPPDQPGEETLHIKDVVPLVVMGSELFEQTV